MNEDSLKNGLPIKGRIIYSAADSFYIDTTYRITSFSSDYWREKHFNRYYLTNTNKPLTDIVILTFYKKELDGIEVYTRNQPNIDSLINLTESFFNRKFETSLHKSTFMNYDSLKYGEYYKGFEGKWTSSSGSFHKKKVGVYYRHDLVYNEMYLLLTNGKVKSPSWCGTKTSWWYRHAFWR